MTVVSFICPNNSQLLLYNLLILLLYSDRAEFIVFKDHTVIVHFISMLEAFIKLIKLGTFSSHTFSGSHFCPT